ncbi:MAG TPA: HAD family hydrolase [Candidatus Pullichristensenella stercorigallinarum]|uniref:HAD family hydrolase n=1 Tax=Candidatus Pullichristensenella stercorigallinarum TaxID=2840909 RepID=A0A9D0ZLX2_9FIRM|nr:HAD family hydrolase [Candidatus Pullichristensenella stercorigallinarum]
MRYRCIAFDIDGTLLDSAPADLAGLQAALKAELGLELPAEALLNTFGMPGREILSAIGVAEEDHARVMRVWKRGKRDRAAWMRVFPGIAETLAALRERGVLLGVVTSKRPESYAADFTPFGLDGYFDILVTCADTALHKPHPEPLYKFLERAGARAREALYIGDSVYDRDCARAAGVDFALATWGSAHPDMEGVTWRLGKPEDILDILET